MPRGKRCDADCTCGRHNRPRRTPEEIRQSHADYRARHREEARDRSRRWRDSNPDRVKANNRISNRGPGWAQRLKYLYGLSPERYARMAADQGGQCYLCGEPLDFDEPGKVHIDHDHSCCRGARSCGTCIRGLACEPCNKGIGSFGDSPERMRRAADQLEMAIRQVEQRQEISYQAPLFRVSKEAVTPFSDEMS